MSSGSQGAYQVLARKWRPRTFKDLVGQDIMVQILTNALKTDRLGHAFILTGERGVGKTSTARILARAINCVGRSVKESVDPCGSCATCVDILEERHLDVLEMDAASHTSVDDIREIISSARYLPSSALYKIYIIDEVHMLSKSAFNALLKTLEEPPPHVKFIFATTEIHKVPVTILSRCCRFDLKRIVKEDMKCYLETILKAEDFEAEEAALNLIAHFADGSLRDALSLLDQTLNMCEKNEDGKSLLITVEQVRGMVGALEGSEVIAIFEAVHGGEMQRTLKMTEDFYQKGADAIQLIKDLLGVTYILSRLKIDPGFDLEGYSPHDQKHLRELSSKLSTPVLQRTWQILSKGWAESRSSPVSALSVQMVLLRLGYIQDLPPLHEWPFLAPVSGDKIPLEENDSQKERLERTEERDTFSTGDLEGPSFSSLEEIANFLLKKKEVRLYTLLWQEAHFVDLKGETLTLRLDSKDALKDQLQLARVLTALTHRKWVVHLSQEEGQPTLSEKKASFEKARLLEAQKDPLLQEVLKTFENAHIEKIIDNPLEEECKIFQK